MKTAMQELLEWAKNSDMSDTMISPQDLLNVINPLLEKEKQQIIDFAYKILETSDNHQSGYCNVEEIYNQTYKPETI